MSAAVKTWIVCITGFGQTVARESGIEKLQDELHRQCSSDTTRVLLKSWRDSPSDLAERIFRRQPEGNPPRIVIIGYSYGGATGVKLASELKRRGLKVDVMLLIDAVWRPTQYLPSFLSLLRWWVIDVPNNVRTLYSWRQKVNRPSGHRLNVARATQHESITLNVIHQYMDDQQGVHEIARRVACPGVAA